MGSANPCILNSTVFLNDSFIPVTPTAFVIHMQNPYVIICMESVTTNGIIFRYAIAKPLTIPQRIPAPIIMKKAVMELPPLLMYITPSMADIAMTGGIDKSMPPPIRTNVIPIDITASDEVWSKILDIFLTVKK